MGAVVQSPILLVYVCVLWEQQLRRRAKKSTLSLQARQQSKQQQHTRGSVFTRVLYRERDEKLGASIETQKRVSQWESVACGCTCTHPKKVRQNLALYTAAEKCLDENET
jgi:hypothetical protein